MNFFKNLTRRRVEPIVRGASFVVLLMILPLAGCSQGGSSAADVTGNLNGTWKDSYSTVTINSSAKTIKYLNNYEGTIENSPDYTASNGVLIIKFTKYWEGDYDSYPDITYNETTDNNEKYGALYWKNLTADSVYMADAYNGLTHAMFAALAEAQANFTMDKAGNYIDWSILAPYKK